MGEDYKEGNRILTNKVGVQVAELLRYSSNFQVFIYFFLMHVRYH